MTKAQRDGKLIQGGEFYIECGAYYIFNNRIRFNQISKEFIEKLDTNDEMEGKILKATAFPIE